MNPALLPRVLRRYSLSPSSAGLLVALRSGARPVADVQKALQISPRTLRHVRRNLADRGLIHALRAPRALGLGERTRLLVLTSDGIDTLVDFLDEVDDGMGAD